MNLQKKSTFVLENKGSEKNFFFSFVITVLSENPRDDKKSERYYSI